MTLADTPNDAASNARAAWSRRVRRIGGFIQLAFATFWLLRGSHNLAGVLGLVMYAVSGIAVVVALVYGVRATAGAAPRPTGPEARRIERSVTIATVLQLAASFVVPLIVIAAGKPDWVLPSIAITIGPLLLWLDHVVQIPRYRWVGWALVLGPVALAATMSGSSLAAVTGIAAGALLLGTAFAGFRDLARATNPPREARHGTAPRSRAEHRTDRTARGAGQHPHLADRATGPIRNGLGPDREAVQSRLEERFPQEDPGVIAGAIEDAAEEMVGARITAFRPLLVEHNASDAIAHRPPDDAAPVPD